MSRVIKNITVLLPIYNAAEYLSRAINSILRQSFKEFELLIIDDGSKDNPEKIISSFKDSRIIYKKFEHSGLSSALNKGIKLAKTEWIARQDADDLSVPDRFQKQIEFLSNSNDTDILSCWSIYFNNKNKIAFKVKTPVQHETIVEFLNLHNPLNHSGVVYRKSIFKENKYNESLKYFEDFEFFHRIKNKVRFAIIPEYLVYSKLDTYNFDYIDNRNIVYDFLFDEAFKNMLDSKSKGDHFYWTTKIAWINYFYGDRKKTRKYFYNSFSLKNILGFLSTYLPDEIFEKFLTSRARFRIENLFSNNKKFYQELRQLLNEH